jgi:glycosyltransferase involved in cell wall biosynthesis
VITGFQQDVRPYVEACDTMTLCSFTEALSMAVIEAMALSKPVVHSDVGGASEIIVPGDNGFLFRVGDTDTFVRHLRVLADRDTARTMGATARTTIESRFAEATMVRRYDSLLEEIVSRKRARAERGHSMIHAAHDADATASQARRAERLS